jgi:kynurenine formamidase
MERRVPTKEEVLAYLLEDRNWGRWGPNDQVGAVNMVTPEKRAAAARLVRSGRAVSLSREFPKTPAPNNPTPAQHYMKRLVRGETSGGATDYYGISYHGTATTHLDALCHVWDGNGMWNGRNPDQVITFDGATWGSVEHWKEGIITRGVLLDVPRHRGQPFVTMDQPIHGWELEDIAREEGVTLEPGDALVVYGGREAWNRVNPTWGSNPESRPGLHASCLKFIRQSDCSLLVWDMMDFTPNGYDLSWTVHGSIFAYGIGLLDNALLEPLAEICAEEGRYEFMLTVNPLRVVGGTGSPVNPIALF